MVTIFHRQITASQHSHAFGPAGSDIDHLHRAGVLARSTRTAVMDQIGLNVASGLLVPGDASRGNVAYDANGPPGAFEWQAWYILPDPSQDALDCRYTDAVQLFQPVGSNSQLAMASHRGSGVRRFAQMWSMLSVITRRASSTSDP